MTVKKHKQRTKFDDGLNLTPTSANPSTPAQGDLQYAGSSHSSLSEGLYRYDGTQWKAAGGGVGSLTYIKTYKANDDGTGDWTVKSIDSLIPDFGATDTLTATFSGSDTGEALFTNDSADKVYNLKSTTGSQYDAVGFNVNIPAYARGKDVGLSFFYRTEDTSGDSADGDYMVWVFDQTNGVETTFNDTPGTFSAGTSITVTSSTGMAVGDKIWIEEASQVVETHITAIADSTHVTLADAVTCGAADRFVTGVLTDVLTTLDAADSDTNEIGEKFQVTFLPPETCTQVCVMIQQLTSETDSKLNFDGLLLDSSPFSKISTQGTPEEYRAYDYVGHASTNTNAIYFNTVSTNTISSLGTITNDATSGFTFTATQRCMVNISASYSATSGGVWYSILKNGDLTANATNAINDGNRLGVGFTDAASRSETVSGFTIAEPGDVIAIGTDATSGGDTGDYAVNISLVATPLTNEAHIVESTDSVVSEWTSYTPTFTGFGTVTNIDCKWRRVGSDMEIEANYTTGTATGVEAQVTLPNGYIIESTQPLRMAGTFGFGSAGVANAGGFVLSTGGDNFLNFSSKSVFSETAAAGLTPVTGSSAAHNSYDMGFKCKIPIAGWDANPKPLLAFPTVTYGQEPEEYRTDDAQGYGSTNTRIPYFKTTPSKDTISNLGTIENSSSNGFSFTATKRCLVTLSVSIAQSSAVYTGISLNSSELTTDVQTLTNHEDALAVSYGTGTNANNGVSVRTVMEPGDILRPHCGTTATIYTGDGYHSLTLVAEPIQGVTNQAAIISQPVAFVEDRKASGTSGGTSSATETARTLNTLSGDIAAVGVSLDGTDGFKFDETGKYHISWTSPFYGTNNRVKTSLYNETSGKYLSFGSSLISAALSSSDSIGEFVGIIKAGDILAINYEVQTAAATTGLGSEAGTQISMDSASNYYELYTQVKITRLK